MPAVLGLVVNPRFLWLSMRQPIRKPRDFQYEAQLFWLWRADLSESRNCGPETSTEVAIRLAKMSLSLSVARLATSITGMSIQAELRCFLTSTQFATFCHLHAQPFLDPGELAMLLVKILCHVLIARPTCDFVN